jgi:hypothetical protein
MWCEVYVLWDYLCQSCIRVSTSELLRVYIFRLDFKLKSNRSIYSLSSIWTSNLYVK